MKSAADLRADALAIWQAGVEAVRSDRLVKENVRVEGDWLVIGENAADEPLRLSLRRMGRVAVVGAGKAGAGMAAGLLEAIGPQVVGEKKVSGWINVPADCVRELGSIHLHAARPAGVNEPTAEGVFGTARILEIVSALGADDLCICLISGGGSALMPAPVQGVSLEEKQAITRLLSAGGANIEELNTVRKRLSRVKGGGLARACRAGRLLTLIVSDVLGDPLDVIASGPTVADSRTAGDALAILDRYMAGKEMVAPGAIAYLRRVALSGEADHGAAESGAVVRYATHRHPCDVTNLVIGNNAVAVDAAGMEAERRGYSHAMHAASKLEGAAEDVGCDLAQMALRMAVEEGPDCLVTGGEPTVKLAAADVRGKGGRNQQLVLAALIEVLKAEQQVRFALLSAGTDGEDGPTDAAGAVMDADLMTRLQASGLDPADYLRRNDAYSLFERLGGLIKTGPTHTNVCDLRVVVVDRQHK
jgi:glycerate 2-kinase